MMSRSLFVLKDSESDAMATQGEMKQAPRNGPDGAGVISGRGCRACERNCRMRFAPAESPAK